MQYKNLLLALLLLTAPFMGFAQGPISGYMGGRGTTDIALSYATETFGSYLFGTEEESRPLTTQSLNFFLEHSFSDTIALVATLPYLWIDETNKGLQDASIFFKYRNDKAINRSGYLNLITAVGLSFPASRYPDNTETPIGLRAIAFQGRFLGQYNFRSGLFLQLKSGFDFRLVEELQTSIPLLFRAGFGARHYFIEGWIEQYTTLNTGSDLQVSGGSGSNWTRLGASLFIPTVKNFGLVFGGAWILGGRNIGLSSRWNTGLVYRWDRRKKP